MAKEKKVVDASVIVKWFTEERYTIQALTLRDQHVDGSVLLVTPAFASLEVVNALRYTSFEQDALERIPSLLDDLQLHILETHGLLEPASRLALQHDISVYDAVYLAAADAFETTLVTADHDLAEVQNGRHIADVAH